MPMPEVRGKGVFIEKHPVCYIFKGWYESCACTMDSHNLLPYYEEEGSP